MGVLSRAAESTFRKSRKRAYVPEWWRAASFAVGGAVLAVVLVVGALQSDDPVDTGTAAGAPVSGGGLAAGQVVVSPPQVGAPVPGSAQPSSQAPAAATQDMVEVALGGGGSTTLPMEALLVGQRAARALFTGNFSGVALADGAAAPLVVQPWKEPTVGNVKSVVVFPDGSFSAAYDVDPDGESGPEPSRTVNVNVEPASAGWAFRPAA